MTTITITINNDNNLNFKKTNFEDLNDFLNTLREDVSDYNDPEFSDTIVTDEILEKASKTREKITQNPQSFFEI